ncbi:MAG: hypothetical protein ABI625_02385 [bacterium]
MSEHTTPAGNLSALAQTTASRRALLHKAGVSAAPPVPPVATPATIRAAAGAMDAMHENGIKSFPAKTAGKGNQPLAARMEKGVKCFDLTAWAFHCNILPHAESEHGMLGMVTALVVAK